MLLNLNYFSAKETVHISLWLIEYFSLTRRQIFYILRGSQLYFCLQMLCLAPNTYLLVFKDEAKCAYAYLPPDIASTLEGEMNNLKILRKKCVDI